MSVRIPGPKVPLLDKNGLLTPEWYIYFSQLPNFVPPEANPSHFNSPGVPNQLAEDANGNFYVCRAPNVWVKYAATSTNF